MNFTPKANGPVLGGILTIVAAGLVWWGSHAGPLPSASAQDVRAMPESQVSDTMRVIPAVQIGPAPDLQMAGPNYYQPVSSYQHHSWWKRNAPIVGGAGGGALVGGLVGGGKGALIGGAVGGGGGYLYKRHKQHHYYHHHRYD